MTSRYGRNQKRRARQALADANLLIDTLTGINADQRLRAAKLRQELERTRDAVDEFIERVVWAVGPDSALIPWVKRPPSIGPLDYIPARWSVSPRVRASLAAVKNISMAEAFDYVVDLYELVLRLERDDVQLRRSIRILVKHPLYDEFEGQAAILVSADMFDRRGLSPRDVDMLFDMYREKLKAFIANGGMVPRRAPKQEARHA